MNDAFLISAGCLGMLVAVVHGYLGATQVVQPFDGVSASSKRVMHAIMFLSAVYWFVCGAALVAAPSYLDSGGRLVVAAITGAVFLTGALANFWATRGRHFGWMLLAIVTLLIWLGAS